MTSKNVIVILVMLLTTSYLSAQSLLEIETASGGRSILNFDFSGSTPTNTDGYQISWNSEDNNLDFRGFELGQGIPGGPFLALPKTRMSLTGSGRLGIGTIDPQQLLHVANPDGNARMRLQGVDGNLTLDFYDYIIDLNFQQQSRYRGGVGMDTDANRLFMYHQGNGLFVKDGKVGISGIDPQGSHSLSVNGTASKSSSGSWAANSDRRLKKNISYLRSEEVLQKVLAMKGVTYEWEDTSTGIKRPVGLQHGFIAQDLEQIWPEKISKDQYGYLMTAYGDYDPMFVEAIKAQQSIIENQQDLLDGQQDQINLLIAELSSIKASLGSSIDLESEK